MKLFRLFIALALAVVLVLNVGIIALADTPEIANTSITASDAQKQNQELAKLGIPKIDPAIKQKADEWRVQAALERTKA